MHFPAMLGSLFSRPAGGCWKVVKQAWRRAEASVTQSSGDEYAGFMGAMRSAARKILRASAAVFPLP
jgi:hypothetical protein